MTISTQDLERVEQAHYRRKRWMIFHIGLFLVVETGAKYPLLDDAAAAALGYAASAAVPVPATVLALLPTGPELRVLGGDG